MVYYTFACNGHVIGTGYDYATKTYTGWYTDFAYAFSNQTLSTNNVQYDASGCNDYVEGSLATKETTYRTEFTTIDGWLIIEAEGFEDHGTKTFEDNREEPLYQAALASSADCAWSDQFVSREPPYHTYISVATHMKDESAKTLGTVTVTIELDMLDALIQELGKELETLSVIILDDRNHVVSSSDGGNSHPILESCTGERSVELYYLGEYSEVMLKQGKRTYTYLYEFINQNPDFSTKLDDKVNDISDENLYHAKAVHGYFTTTAGEYMLLAGARLIDKCGLEYTLYTILGEAELVATIENQKELAHEEIQTVTAKILIGVFSGCVGIMILTFMLARAISSPLHDIRKDINHLAELDFSGRLSAYRPFVSELKFMITQYMKLKITLCDFNCFVPPHILDDLVDFGDDALKRTAVQKEVGVLFVYVSNFSAASHNSPNEVIAEFANQFIGEAADLVQNMSGTVIDFFGDSIFGIFNAPFDDPNYVKNSMECANEIIALFERVKAEFMSENPDFQLIEVRVGLHCGDALVGKIGSKSRLKYCAVGDTVNLGSRIENMNRRYGSQLVCSSDFFLALDDHKDHYVSRPMEYVKVQGRNEPILIYEIGGLINSVEESKLQEYKAHTDLFFDLRAGQAGTDELEAHIHKYGGNAVFLRSATVRSEDLKEVKKSEIAPPPKDNKPE